VRLIADGVVDREGVPGLARRLAVSVRHLHRLLVEGVGAPPLALARSQRAYQARLLAESTTMPFGEIAFAAGFASIRQFNETLRQFFAATPSQLRAAHRRGMPQPAGGLALRLAARAPHDPHGVLRWLATQAIPGVEECTDDGYRRVLRLPPARGRTVRELAERLASGELVVDEGADRAAARRTLLTVPGIGPALAEQLGLCALGNPDAFPASDPRLHARPAATGCPATPLAWHGGHGSGGPGAGMVPTCCGTSTAGKSSRPSPKPISSGLGGEEPAEAVDHRVGGGDGAGRCQAKGARRSPGG
jgi:hypothetical protein